MSYSQCKVRMQCKVQTQNIQMLQLARFKHALCKPPIYMEIGTLHFAIGGGGASFTHYQNKIRDVETNLKKIVGQ